MSTTTAQNGKVIITCAVTGAIHTPSMTPHLPITPDEIAGEAIAAAEAGATAVIQPGGSMRDDAVIEAADEAGLAMVFTGMRHFRH